MHATLEANTQPLVEVRFSYTTELVLAATLATGRLTPLSGFDEKWQREQAAALPESSRKYLERTRRFSCPTLSFIDFIARSREFDDPDRLFSLVREYPIREFLYIILNSDISEAGIAECLADPSLSSVHVPHLSFFSRMAEDDLAAIFTDPETFRGELVDFVASNRTPVFENKIKELGPRYAEKSAAMEARLASSTPQAVIAEIKKKPTMNNEYRRFTFAPSYFEGDMNISGYSTADFLFLFNIASTPSTNAAGIRLSERVRTLGDKSRMELLRQLSGGPSYGKGLSGRLGLTTATVSRHLDQLKKAGLVIEEQADAQNVKLVRLDRAGLEELLDEIRRYICADCS